MPDRYDPKSFEDVWQRRWKEADLFRTREEPGRPKFYGLDFFPYPSGAGLSVGHCRNYIPTDALCRMKYMQGYNVLHPMGFDAFGLPAENEAIKRQVAPGPMVKQYAENYRRQMDLVGISYDWSRSFSSSDPEYYRWTQWIFELLYERGLAYRKEALVNWDPVDKTVLADEEVVGGRAERSGALVEKKSIPQWFFKITEYAQRLLDDLDELDWPEGIKQQQRNWIGRSEGVEFSMRVTFDDSPAVPNEDFRILNEEREPTLRVFTTRIDTIFGMTFCVLSPEHPLVDVIAGRVPEERRNAIEEYRRQASTLSEAERQQVGREKTGVFSGAYAVNPATGKRVPIWIADYVLMGYGTGAIMAVPGNDQRDLDFARKFGLPAFPVVAPSLEAAAEAEAMVARGEAYESKDGVLIHSGEYTGLTVREAQESLAQWMEALGIGERKVHYRLRDWLISRQRYWGCPIPVIHAASGEIQLVEKSLLPVELPPVENYQPTGDGSSPLARIPEFVNVTDRDGRLGRRETDTMGGFACSSWYFLRFCDPHNSERPWDYDKVAYWMPVDCYVGGAEHAVMHLLYARFWTKVLYDAGLVPVKEPFKRLVNQGQVLALTPYRLPREGEKLDVGEEGILISFEEAKTLPEDQVIWRWARMSKSKGNVITPDEMVEQYGADALRVYELFVAPIDAPIQWSNEGMAGAVRFLNRVFRTVDDLKGVYTADWRSLLDAQPSSPAEEAIRRATHRTIKGVTEDIEAFAMNTAVAKLMIFVNDLRDFLERYAPEEHAAVYSEAVETLVLLLSPIAPFSADELWSTLGREGFTYRQDWPVYDPVLATPKTVTVAVSVNGKLRDTIEAPLEAPSEELERLARASERVLAHLEGKEVQRVVVVPGKMVNFVVK